VKDPYGSHRNVLVPAEKSAATKRRGPGVQMVSSVPTSSSAYVDGTPAISADAVVAGKRPRIHRGGLHWFDRANVEEALPALSSTAVVTRRWLELLLPAVDLHLATGAPWWMAVAASLIEQGERVRSGSFRETRVHNVRRVGGRNVRDAGRVIQDPGLPEGLVERASGSRWTRDPVLVAQARAGQRSVVFGGRRDEFDGDLLLVDHVFVGHVPQWLRPMPLFEIDRADAIAESIRAIRAALCRILGRAPSPGVDAPLAQDTIAREVGFADAAYDAFRNGDRA